MSRLNKLDVFYHDRPVGTMALYQKRLAAFDIPMIGLWTVSQSARFHYRLKSECLYPRSIRLKGCLVYLRIVCRMDGDVYW